MSGLGHLLDGSPRVVGLDLSLTSTGMSDGTFTEVCQTTPEECLEARLSTLVHTVAGFVLGLRPADLAVIEAPAWSRTGPGHEELAALRVMVRTRLWQLHIPYAMVPPSTIKLFTAGHGKATKAQMVEAVATRYGADFGQVKVKDGRYDRADAFALAAMGLDRVGHPLGEAAHRDSLNAVLWPSLLLDN